MVLIAAGLHPIWKKKLIEATEPVSTGYCLIIAIGILR